MSVNNDLGGAAAAAGRVSGGQRECSSPYIAVSQSSKLMFYWQSNTPVRCK